jgi:hypothetical protein
MDKPKSIEELLDQVETNYKELPDWMKKLYESQPSGRPPKPSMKASESTKSPPTSRKT